MSTGLLPDRLLRLAEELPLPGREELSLMAENELLINFLQRKLLEGLAELVVDQVLPEEDDLSLLAERLGVPSGPNPEAWRSVLEIPLDRLQSMATFPGGCGRRPRRCGEKRFRASSWSGGLIWIR